MGSRDVDESVERLLDIDTPSPARMYDYFLGGSHNFPADRRMAEQVIAVYPDFPFIMRANRAFLRRAVTFLVEQGIDQFLDIGSGVPTVGTVHEIVHCHNPAARVVYVDSDPIAVHHSLAVLKDIPSATVIRADARRPERILAHPEVQRLLDLNRPVAVILAALLHFITDDVEASAMVATLSQSLMPGGYLVISHGTDDDAPRDSIEQSERLYAKSTNPGRARTRAQIAAFFDGLELVDPGLVYAPSWHPDDPDDLFLDEPSRSINLVGVGRKP